MVTKYFEIRDRGTCLIVMAQALRSTYPVERRALRRAGFADDGAQILVTRLDGGNCTTHYSPYNWGQNPRTMFVAHQHITQEWGNLKSGDLIDVRVVLNEETTPAVPEIFTEPVTSAV